MQESSAKMMNADVDLEGEKMVRKRRIVERSSFKLEAEVVEPKEVSKVR